MREIAADEASPSVTRVSDAYETAFSFSTRTGNSILDRVKSKALSTYLEKRKGYDLEQMCLAFIGYEGTKAHVAAQRKLVGRIVGRRGAVHRHRARRAVRPEEVRYALHPRLPARPRRSCRRVGDLSPWSVLPELYDNVMAAARGVRRARGAVVHHVPPLALLPRRRLPLLHVRLRHRDAGSRSSSTTS